MAELLKVVHDQANHRFVLMLDGNAAYLRYRQREADVDFYHTFVPEVLRGRGIAERLCQTAFEYAKAQGLTVIPSCSYISGAYLKRHPEYQPLTKS